MPYYKDSSGEAYAQQTDYCFSRQPSHLANLANSSMLALGRVIEAAYFYRSEVH